jgi:formylglycine-generating enzyme required for sulfatase activity
MLGRSTDHQTGGELGNAAQHRLLYQLGIAAAAPRPESGAMAAIGDSAFELDLYEVTNQQMAVFLNDAGNKRVKGVAHGEMTSAHVLIEEVAGIFRPKEGFANHPSVEVSYAGARAYCEWAGKRLPTEAEWQLACEGPEGLTFAWGHHLRVAGPEALPRANIFGAADGFLRTAPVGSFPHGRSAWGIYDMGGNVWEWAVSAEGESRLRGGSWVNGKLEVNSQKQLHISLVGQGCRV